MELGLTNSELPGGSTVVTVTGDVDVYTAPQLRHRLIETVDAGQVQLIVDLTGVDFIDSTGLGVLVGALKRARAADSDLVVVCRAKRLLKLFRITGLTRVFQIVPDVKAAHAWHTDRTTVAEPPDPDGEPVGWHWVPSRIYLNDERDHQAVQEAVERVGDAFGFEVVYAFPAVAGSWFRELLIRLKRSGQLPSKEEQFVKLGRAVDLRLLHRQQAEVDAAQGAAVAGLIQSLEGTPRAIVQIGSVLLVKVDDVLVVRNLTQAELAHWERNPALFRDPAAALQQLQQAAAEQAEVTAHRE